MAWAFEIDIDISVSDLQQSGFRFGIDYFGNPIVADEPGKIRMLQADKNYNNLQFKIGEQYKLHLKYFLELPIQNVRVV